MPYRRTYIDIKTDGKARLTNATPISEFGSTSIAGSFLDIIASESDQLYNEIEYLHRAMDPTRNFGQELDNLGYLLGITRNNSNSAVDDSLTNFYFYIDKRTNMTPAQLINSLYPVNSQIRSKLYENGYIDSIVDPTKIIIPKGMVIYNNNRTISYVTLQSTIISSTTPNAYVNIAAISEGTFSNVQANTLVKHDIGTILLLKDISKYILCANTFPIQTGNDGMTDSEFRYKISTYSQRRNSNEISIRNEILGIPGIRNIYFERGKYGYGTYSIIVEGTSPLVSEGLLRIVRQRLDALDGNDAAFIYAPIYKGVELSFNLFIDIGYDQDSTKEIVRTNIIQYINNTKIGDTLIWNDIISIIINVPGVVDFITDYYKIGDYNAFKKLNQKQIVLRTINQRAHTTEKFYTDKGLIKVCSRQTQG